MATLILSAVSYPAVRWGAEHFGATWVREAAPDPRRQFIEIAMAIGTCSVALFTALYMQKAVFKPRHATFSGAAIFYFLMPGGI